jgi:Lrp/AsnC family transcriptional regulator, regulator for asnA, asnC and gidA
MYPVDDIDNAILRKLLENGRKSFTEIAKETNTSVDVIWKHFTEMEKAGVIVGATTQFNYPKFGYTGRTMTFISTELQYTDQVIERIKKIPELRPFKLYNSHYNIAVISTLKELKDVERISKYISNQNPINEMKTAIWTDYRNLPENFIPSKFSDNKKKVTEEGEIIKTDEIDLKIVEELTKNGRLTFSEIAKNIGSSTGTVNRRYERLIKNGYIRIVLQINPFKLGYKCNFSVNVDLTDHEKIEEVADAIASLELASIIIKVSGTCGLYCLFMIKTLDDVIAINEFIGNIQCVKKLEGWFSPLQTNWPGPKWSKTTF